MVDLLPIPILRRCDAFDLYNECAYNYTQNNRYDIGNIRLNKNETKSARLIGYMWDNKWSICEDFICMVSDNKCISLLNVPKQPFIIINNALYNDNIDFEKQHSELIYSDNIRLCLKIPQYISCTNIHETSLFLSAMKWISGMTNNEINWKTRIEINGVKYYFIN